MRPLLPGMPHPWVVAHRGASAGCPENTIAAFDRAVADGCDAIELDVQLSRDGVPIVFHDWTLARAGLRGRRVERLDADELRTLDVGEGLGIPALREVLRRHAPQVVLLLELKSHERDRARGRHLALAEAVAALIRAEGLEDRIWLLGFDAETLAAASRGGLPRAALNLSAPRRPTRALRRQVERWQALSIDVRTLSAEVAAVVHDAGKPLMAWTCNTPRRVERALARGADAIMSDRPAWLRNYLESRKR